MRILQNYKVPTGNILITQGEKGKLEMLSVGDYGKDKNLKADFMGLKRKPDSVKHTEMLSLEEKWVITISTQYGCAMRCTFCDVPKVNFKGNATFYDLINQVITGIKLHPEIKRTKRLNIHFARMGEPTWNPDVLEAAKWFHTHLKPEHDVVHPVVSTMMPRKNQWLKTFIHNWMRIKNRLYNGNAGLQISVNSTNLHEREKMFKGNSLYFEGMARILDGIIPYGRKITLNFAIADYEIDPHVLLHYFDPELYLIKLTPMHKTQTALENEIKTSGDYTEYYPYEKYETELRETGYDVIVFIASHEEDLSRITCGNAILSGTKPASPLIKE